MWKTGQIHTGRAFATIALPCPSHQSRYSKSSARPGRPLTAGLEKRLIINQIAFRSCRQLQKTFTVIIKKSPITDRLPKLSDLPMIMRTYLLLVTLFLCGSGPLVAQPGPKAVTGKLSPMLSTRSIAAQQDTLFYIACTDLSRFKDLLARHGLLSGIRQEYTATRLVAIRCSRRQLDSLLLPSPLVLFADRYRRPREEQLINNYDMASNQVNLVHSLYPALDGRGLVVSIKENTPDTTDIDLRGRYLSTRLAARTVSQHASAMSTLIAGAGNSDLSGTGAARAAVLTASDFASLLPDADADYRQYAVTAQNHSYGTGIENYYGADAAAYDASSLANPSLLHVFSAGNAGGQASPTGTYAGLPGYANLTGSFKMAKNILTVGAVNRLLEPEALGSKGPAYDGRVKPELVAFGEDGSSGAAAITTGTTLLVQQAFRDLTGNLPPAVLTKAILLNTAEDAGRPGIDYQTGYGSVNAYGAISAVQQDRYTTGTIGQGQVYTVPLSLAAGISRLKVTLCWYDPPAGPNAPKALVNDLDLSLINTSTGEVWLPWVLNPAAHPDSLDKAPVRARDSLNNNEQVSLDLPAPGNYQVRVQGHSLPGGAQSFALCWQPDTAGRLQWQYPARGDLIHGGAANVLRWKSTFDKAATARIEYTVDGNHWRLIDDHIDPATGHYTWQAPDTLTAAVLRMLVDQQVYQTDTCIIATRPTATTGFNCADSFLLGWSRPPGIARFQVYVLGEKYLEPLTVTSDTQIVLGKPAHPALYYAVAPLLPQGLSGMRSLTFNYMEQGVDCYIKRFLADRAESSSRLSIELGTLYALRSLTVQKKGAGDYADLQSVNPVSQLNYQLTDATLSRGLNTYRLKLLRTDGSVIYSQPETVYNFQEAGYIVFPNPINAGAQLQVIAAEPGAGSIRLFNALGQPVLDKPLVNLHEQISLRQLQRGVYFYQIRQAGTPVQTGSLVIQ